MDQLVLDFFCGTKLIYDIHFPVAFFIGSILEDASIRASTRQIKLLFRLGITHRKRIAIRNHRKRLRRQTMSSYQRANIENIIYMSRASSRPFPTETRARARTHTHYKTLTEFSICRGGETGPKRKDAEKQVKRFHPSDHASMSPARY